MRHILMWENPYIDSLPLEGISFESEYATSVLKAYILHTKTSKTHNNPYILIKDDKFCFLVYLIGKVQSWYYDRTDAIGFRRS